MKEIKSMKELDKVMQRSIKGGHSMGVYIYMPDFPHPELIINAHGNLEKKLAYYKDTYDAELEHKHAKGIRIVGYVYGI